MLTFDEALTRAEHYHGHICSGQVLGIRMIQHGLRLMGLENDNLRDLMVFVESDRCVLDAVYAATGLTMGRRRVKLKPHGKTAMSLVDLNTGLGFRVWVKCPDFPPPDADCKTWWAQYTDDQLFGVSKVHIAIPPEDLPGRPKYEAECDACGASVLDNRHVEQDGRTLCLDCANGPYWTEVTP